ncbi:MAG: TIR domain-containing protein [Thermoanaerobaculia bacterium]
MSYKPRVFIGSSTKGQEVARAIAEGLAGSASLKPWWTSFALARTYLEELDTIAREVEFAVFVLTPDDTRDRGIGAASVPRDNVLFELGLFTGSLGRDRTFAVRPRGVPLELPTNLGGMHVAEFNSLADSAPATGSERDSLLYDAVSDAVGAIKKEISRSRIAVVRPPSAEIVKVFPQRRFVAAKKWNAFIRGAEKHLWLYGMAELGYAEDEETEKTFLKVPRGCDVRVLLLNPESPHTQVIAQDEHTDPEALRVRIRISLTAFSKMQAMSEGRIKVRVYDSFPQVSVVRADERALITIYIRPLAGNDCPTFEIHRRDQEKGVFHRFVKNFEAVWQSAREWQ